MAHQFDFYGLLSPKISYESKMIEKLAKIAKNSKDNRGVLENGENHRLSTPLGK